MKSSEVAALLDEPACAHNNKEKSGCARPKPGATAGGPTRTSDVEGEAPRAARCPPDRCLLEALRPCGVGLHVVGGHPPGGPAAPSSESTYRTRRRRRPGPGPRRGASWTLRRRRPAARRHARDRPGDPPGRRCGSGARRSRCVRRTRSRRPRASPPGPWP